MKVKPRIYLSSTFKDLQTYRTAAIRALMAVGFNDLIAMEFYTARTTTTLRSCLDDVGSCDLYILLLGYMYGSIPIECENKELSYTHHEFREARRLKKKILVLKAKNSELEKMLYSPLSESEKDWHRDKLSNFETEIWGQGSNAGPMFSNFYSEADLKSELLQAVIITYQILEKPKIHLENYEVSYCDRKKEELEHWLFINTAPLNFKVLEIRAAKDAAACNLINRIIYNYFPPKLAEFFFEIKLRTIFSQRATYEKIKIDFLANIYRESKNIYELNFNFDQSENSVLDFFKKIHSAVNGYPIIIKLSYSDKFLSETQKKILNKILEEFNYASTQIQDIKLYVFIDVITDSNSYPISQTPNYHYVISDLENINPDDDFSDWFCRIVYNDKQKFYRYQKQNHLEAPNEISMLEAIPILENFIEYFNSYENTDLKTN